MVGEKCGTEVQMLQVKAELSTEPLSNPTLTVTLVKTAMVGHKYH